MSRTIKKSPYLNFWLLDHYQREAIIIPMALMLTTGLLLGNSALSLMLAALGYVAVTLLVFPTILRGGNAHANDSVRFLVGCTGAVLVMVAVLLFNPLVLLSAYQIYHTFAIRIKVSLRSLQALKREMANS